jgi:hypothetical protein
MSPGSSKPPKSVHRLRILLVLILVLLTIQGWFGDTTNIFVTTGTVNPVPFSLGAIFPVIISYGPILIWHAFEGFLLIILSIAAIVLTFVWSKSRSVRIMSVLGSGATISAAFGGLSFVASGFTAPGSSAEMGGSFIGAYAFYFMALYFTK